MITGYTSSGRTYHHNGDFSGEVMIVAQGIEVRQFKEGQGDEYALVSIPTADLVDIVGECVRRQRVIAAESLPTWALVGLEQPLVEDQP